MLFYIFLRVAMTYSTEVTFKVIHVSKQKLVFTLGVYLTSVN